MKVSVIVPVYNVKPYLKRCLDSIVNQTLKDIEIIIVDDGSTDGSAEYVDKYALCDSRIRVIHKENGGLMSAWTMGVKSSLGDYIGFVDSDDYISLNMFKKMYDKALQYNADIVICNYSINHTIEGKLKTALAEGCYEDSLLQNRIKEHVFPVPGSTYILPLPRWNKLFRKQLVFDNLKYTKSLSRTFEDRYFVPAALLNANSVYCLDDVLYYWIQREGSNHGMYKSSLLDDIKRYYKVQHLIVEEHAPLLKDYWELSFSDGIKQYVVRNIIRVKGFSLKYASAKQLLNDEMCKSWMCHYGTLLTSKLGKFINYSFKFNSPALLVLGGYLGAKKYKK